MVTLFHFSNVFNYLTIFSPKQVFLQNRTYSEDIADEQTEGDDHECHASCQHYVDEEVGMVGIQPFAHRWHFGQEDEVKQVDVECAGADVLECSSDACLLRKMLLMMTETHDYNEHQRVHGKRLGQVRPLHLHEMPLEDIGTAKEGKHCHKREEPVGIEQPLSLVPIAMHEIAHQEELQELQGLVEGTVHHEVCLVPFAELPWHIQREVCHYTDAPQDGNGDVLNFLSHPLEKG